MRSIRIGTRNSPLAMWQAREVAARLHSEGLATEIIPILASGDKNLNQPLYSMGITGVFTRDLDIALLNNDIDIAVHSLKDVPTVLPHNIELIAYLERDYPQDVLVRKESAREKPLHELSIATSSLRRRAFWLREFPGTVFSDIRGNVQTRLQKLNNGLADATLFSLAGLKRLDLPLQYEELPFLLPAAAQGVVAVAARADDGAVKAMVAPINHNETAARVIVERDFLNALEGGCTAPIGAFSEIFGDQLRFKGALCSLNGEDYIETERVISLEQAAGAGRNFAEYILANGGRDIMTAIKDTP